MGCDIHVYVEVQDETGEWKPHYSPLVPCEECGGTLRASFPDPTCRNCKGDVAEHDEVTQRCFTSPHKLDLVYPPCWCCGRWTPPGLSEDWRQRFYHDRNYDLFGILAGVRGTADDDFTQADRGVPHDASPNYVRQADGPDWHSATWYTVAEVLARKKGWRNFSRWMQFVRDMQKLSRTPEDPDDVRILMFFDN